MRLPAFLLVGVLLLGGCATSDSGASYGDNNGAYLVWNESERPDPVSGGGVTFAGKNIDISDYRGKIVVINTWYAACPPCRAEAPDLVGIANDYDDIVMLGVNTRDNAGTAEAFERSFHIDYPSIDGSDGRFISDLEGVIPLQAVPTTLVLDKTGRPAARYLGRIDPSVVRGILDDLS